MATKSDLDRAASEIVEKLNTKVEKLESRVFDLEVTNDELTKKSISRAKSGECRRVHIGSWIHS